jgi:hypothetical protein
MAQEKKFIKGFSGGMMVHSGYQYGGDNPYDYDPKGATFGIGGVARLHLSDHFRAGFEGYFSTMGLNKDIASGSFNKLFWSGLLADWFWKAGKFYPYLGTGIGGGMETAFYMFKGDKHDWEPEDMAVYNKKPFFEIDPYIGFEYALGKTLRLTVKADYLLAINKESCSCEERTVIRGESAVVCEVYAAPSLEVGDVYFLEGCDILERCACDILECAGERELFKGRAAVEYRAEILYSLGDDDLLKRSAAVENSVGDLL